MGKRREATSQWMLVLKYLVTFGAVSKVCCFGNVLHIRKAKIHAHDGVFILILQKMNTAQAPSLNLPITDTIEGSHAAPFKPLNVTKSWQL